MTLVKQRISQSRLILKTSLLKILKIACSTVAIVFLELIILKMINYPPEQLPTSIYIILFIIATLIISLIIIRDHKGMWLCPNQNCRSLSVILKYGNTGVNSNNPRLTHYYREITCPKCNKSVTINWRGSNNYFHSK